MARNGVASIWPEADAKLRDRWAEGVSCAAIGRELGVSADSIIGRARRISLPRHPSLAHYNLPPPKPRLKSHKRVRPLPVDGGVTLPKLRSVAQPIALPPPPPALLPREGCEFIAGDVRRKGWRKCGDPVSATGSPWCAKHKRLVFVKQSAARADAE